MVFGVVYHCLMVLFDGLLLWLLFRQRQMTWKKLILFGTAGLAGAFVLAVPFRSWHLFAEGMVWHGGAFLLAGGARMFLQRLNGKRSWKSGLVLVLLASIVWAVGVESLLIEPTDLVLKKYEFVTPKVTKPIRIAFLADIQTDRIGDYERKTLELLKEQKADLILLGGDYVQPRNKDHEEKLFTQFNQMMRDAKLQAPLGVWAIRGNVELGYWKGWHRLFEGTGIELVEKTKSVILGEVCVTMLGVHSSFGKRKIRLIPALRPGRYHLMLGHAPCYAQGNQDADLLLAGHTHGGQIWIPGFGPIFTASYDLPRKWASGLTKLSNDSSLIVSNGSGMERGSAPRVRLFCRPQLVVIDLLPKPKDR